MSGGQAGPSEVIHLDGTEPGVLDKTQRSRLLRHQNATLSFASFDPHVATQRDPDISNLSLNEEKCRPKRIVIENVPGHGSFWRWVPSARKQEGVDDEGSFPRLIELCGQLCVCSQTQWDIYKLDPLYDCYVRFPPALTVIVPKGSVQFTTPLPQMGVSAQGSLHDTLSDEDYDSERMLVDDEGTKPKARSRKRGPSPREPLRFDFSRIPPSPPQEPKPKRRARVSFQSLRSAEEEENDYFAEDIQNRNTKLYEPRNQKRARTTSPDFGKRAINAHRIKHETMKRVRMKQELEARKEWRDHQFLREVLADVNRTNGNSERDTQGAGSSDSETEDAADPHDKHEDVIAASVRRMAELNTNRASERSREKKLGLEDTTRLNAQTKRAADAEAERRRLEKDAEEQKLRQQEEKARHQAQQRRQRVELLANVERERQLRHERWSRGPWSVARAIERYKMTSVFFDKANFSEETFPLAFIDIPWPSLEHPSRNTPQNINYESTNQFFDSLKPFLRDQAYKNFLKQCLQRFHPDRWSGRNLFCAILDDDERNEIETAVNSVSKALGSLYTELRNS